VLAHGAEAPPRAGQALCWLLWIRGRDARAVHLPAGILSSTVIDPCIHHPSNPHTPSQLPPDQDTRLRGATPSATTFDKAYILGRQVKKKAHKLEIRMFGG